MPEEDFRLPPNKDDNKKTGLIEDLEMAFLRDINQYPDSGIAQRYKRLEISVRQGQKLKDKLLNQGLILECQETTKTGRLKVIKLTDKGHNTLTESKQRE